MWRDFSLLAICECEVTKNSKSLLLISRDDESNFLPRLDWSFLYFLLFFVLCVF